MINLTVKTLDSKNYHFTLEDQSTVLALKHKIRDSLHVELHKQRLIYSGRILSDNNNLTALDVDGKVIHMVQKEPPSTTMRGHYRGPYSAGASGVDPSGAGPSGAGASGNQVPNEQIRRYVLNDTDRRLVSINDIILDIAESLHDLQQLQQRQNDTNRRTTFVRPVQREITRAQTVEDFVVTRLALETIQGEAEHFRQHFTQMLTGSLTNEREVISAYSERVQFIEHSLAHALHAISDISVEVDNFNNFRLVSQPTSNPMRPSLLVEHLNLVMENALSNANQGINMNAEHHITFTLPSQTPNPGGEIITVDSESESSSDSDVIIVTSDAQEEPLPGTSQAPNQSENGFRMPHTNVYDRFLYCGNRNAVVALQQRRHQLEEQRRETGLTEPATDTVNNAQECTPIIDITDDPEPTLETDEYAIILSDDDSDCVCEESTTSGPSGSTSVSETGDTKAIAAGDSNASDAPEQNWGQSYVPIFNSDEVAQRAGGSNEPLSDAYLAGMSASKRRCVRRQRPPCNLEDFLTACIDAAGDSPHMTENDLRLALSVHMCNLGSTRFSSNEDVIEGATSRRFMYVRRYFNSDRSSTARGSNRSSSNP